MSWTVGETAAAAGVSVRTLHHWDEVGLLRAGGRSGAGYRLYDGDDLGRLQRVLGYRELGFGLEEIARLLDDPAVDTLDSLRRQHALLRERADRLLVVATAVARTMEAYGMGIELTPAQLREVFGSEDPTRHAQEAEQRWGETDAYRESRRRAASYGKQDWQRMKAELDDLERRFGQALRAGLPADGPEAVALAEEHRGHTSRWFYDCSAEMHRSLAQMYVADERFARHYDQQVPGLARYVHDAVLASSGA